MKHTPSDIIRVARKYMGSSQVELSEAINIAQGTLSRFESGKLEPSVSDWFNICTFLKIDPRSYEWGFLELLNSFDSDNDFKLNMKCPWKKSSPTFAVTIRSTIPIWNYLYKMKGKDFLVKFLKSKKIDPDILAVYDFLIPTNFFLQLMGELIDSGAINESNIAAIFKSTNSSEVHGKFYFDKYSRIDNPFEILEEYVQLQNKYQSNFKLKLKKMHKNNYQLQVNAKKDFEATLDNNQNSKALSFLNLYQESFIKNICNIIPGKKVSVESISNEGNFHTTYELVL